MITQLIDFVMADPLCFLLMPFWVVLLALAVEDLFK